MGNSPRTKAYFLTKKTCPSGLRKEIQGEEVVGPTNPRKTSRRKKERQGIKKILPQNRHKGVPHKGVTKKGEKLSAAKESPFILGPRQQCTGECPQKNMGRSIPRKVFKMNQHWRGDWGEKKKPVLSVRNVNNKRKRGKGREVFGSSASYFLGWGP